MEIQTMALTLTRNLGEKLLIGDDITVEVRGVKGNQVQLAITAPRHVEIDRE
ncbi:MAG: carbon storage regulator, partial [Candidatus Thiodiazotropha sp.]